jgi:hypothetical protein
MPQVTLHQIEEVVPRSSASSGDTPPAFIRSSAGRVAGDAL